MPMLSCRGQGHRTPTGMVYKIKCVSLLTGQLQYPRILELVGKAKTLQLLEPAKARAVGIQRGMLSIFEIRFLPKNGQRSVQNPFV